MWNLLQILVILTVSICPHAIKSENALKINTDLTATVISVDSDEIPFNSNAKNQFPIFNSTSNQNESQLQIASATKQNDTHICTREETYWEEIKVPVTEPVRIRASKWCWEFPPRCPEYRTETRQSTKIEKIEKTRTIRFCCAGYEGNISINDTVCKPVCRGGCGRGFCAMPDVCSCEAGYTGKHCTQRCDHDHWGNECKNQCECQNGAACDNKSGMCHCTIGWSGDLCELPCPIGTYGVMCRKVCDCPDKRCHPQTGDCDTLSANVTPNATHAMIETLNSTIVNITHNLDSIAKSIGNIVTSSTESPPLIEPNLLEATSAKSMPEVIVIKQDETHTPKIIVHPASNAAVQSPEVIHVISPDLASLAGVSGNTETKLHETHKTTTDHDTVLLMSILIILLIIIIAIAVVFLYYYRRYHWQKEHVEVALAARQATHATKTDVASVNELGITSKNFSKPLPDLPAFTQMVRNKTEGPDYYDPPSSNSSTKAPSYTYARKESLYSVVAPKSRKGSPESHFYDEIRYSQSAQHNQHMQLTPLGGHYEVHQQPVSVSHHVSHLVIPPTKSSQYLQVPGMSYASHKVALI